MVHFAVILSILFSTLAVLGSTASQSQAELEESCDSPSKARVALQKSRGHKVESVLEEVPDIWSDRESATKKGNSLTQSGLATVSQKWRPKMPNIRWPWNKRPTPAPAPTPSPEDRTLLEGMRQKFMEWAINDFKSFENLLGRDEWMALGHETQTKIIESGPEDVDRVLGDEFNKLPDDVQRKLKERTGLLQVFSQKQALTEGRHADLMQALTEGRHTDFETLFERMWHKFIEWITKDFKLFEKLLGRDEWMALGHEMQTKVKESFFSRSSKAAADKAAAEMVATEEASKEMATDEQAVKEQIDIAEL